MQRQLTRRSTALIKSTLRGMGLEIRRHRPSTSIDCSDSYGTMMAGLYRSKARGVQVRTIVDIGAAQGNWSMMARRVFGDCHFLLIEPLEERRSELQAMQQRYPHTYAVHAAAGNHPGHLEFFVTRDLDGSGIADNGTHAAMRQVPVTTVDIEVSRLALPAPYILKLDTHGYETPILDGATETLKQTELIVMECYGFRVSPLMLLFWEMCDYLIQRGFRLIDLVDVTWRPGDQAFWQCDAFFVPVCHPSFEMNAYVVATDSR